MTEPTPVVFAEISTVIKWPVHVTHQENGACAIKACVCSLGGAWLATVRPADDPKSRPLGLVRTYGSYVHPRKDQTRYDPKLVPLDLGHAVEGDYIELAWVTAGNIIGCQHFEFKGESLTQVNLETIMDATEPKHV